jgi:hypothetical protein
LISAVVARNSQDQANVACRERFATPTGKDLDMSASAAIAPAGPQYMRALQRANDVRCARAQLKRRVAAGEIDVAEVILHCFWEAQSMAVGELLMSQPRWGRTRCVKLLSQIPISETKTIGSMTGRQRRALATTLACAGHGRQWSANV